MKAVDGDCGSWAILPPQNDRLQSLQSPRPLNHGGQLQAVSSQSLMQWRTTALGEVGCSANLPALMCL